LAIGGLRGDLYYGIKAVANMVANTDGDVAALWEGSNEEHSALAKQLVDEVRSGMPILGEMTPGQTFSMRGTQYRYLENKGDGNHLVNTIEPQFNSQWNINPATDNYNDSTLDNNMKNWHDNLPSVVRRQVQPVQKEFTGVGPDAHINENWFSNAEWASGWIPIVGEPRAFILDFENPAFTDALKNDFAEVDSHGEKKAFALSVAEVNHLSGLGKAFPTMASRTNVGTTRTPFGPGHPWLVMTSLNAVPGTFNVINHWNTTNSAIGGQRPALILRDQDGAWTSNI
ncbi:hypothetical protein AALM99_10055, partial [Lactococcus muris]